MRSETINEIGGDITSQLAHRVFRTYSAERVNRLHCFIISVLDEATRHAEAARKEREARQAQVITISTIYETADYLLSEVCLKFGLAPAMLKHHRASVVQEVAKAMRAAEVIDGRRYIVLSDTLAEINMRATDTSRINAEYEFIGTRKDCAGL